MSEPITYGYTDSDHQHHQYHLRESAFSSLNTIIQLHFEKTLEKKRSIDLQKKHLQKLFLLFFLLLALLLSSLLQPRLQCRHCWAPIALLSLAFLIFYVAVAQTLRCIHEFKYQRRCHKLTLAMATERRRRLKRSAEMDHGTATPTTEAEAAEITEIHYQEPPGSYLGKFKRSWAMYFGFLITTFGVMVAASVLILCF